jgi:hypothetical protein
MSRSVVEIHQSMLDTQPSTGDAWLAESMEFEERLAERFKYESRRDPFQDYA